MSITRPLFERQEFTTWRVRGSQQAFIEVEAGYYALAATCVSHVNQRAHRRFSLTADQQKIARAMRLLIYLDSR